MSQELYRGLHKQPISATVYQLSHDLSQITEPYKIFSSSESNVQSFQKQQKK